MINSTLLLMVESLIKTGAVLISKQTTIEELTATNGTFMKMQALSVLGYRIQQNPLRIEMLLIDNNRAKFSIESVIVNNINASLIERFGFIIVDNLVISGYNAQDFNIITKFISSSDLFNLARCDKQTRALIVDTINAVMVNDDNFTLLIQPVKYNNEIDKDDEKNLLTK